MARRTDIKENLAAGLALVRLTGYATTAPTVERVLREPTDPNVGVTWWIGFVGGFLDRYEHAASELSYITSEFMLVVHLFGRDATNGRGVSGWSADGEDELDLAMTAIDKRFLGDDNTRGGYAIRTHYEGGGWRTNEGMNQLGMAVQSAELRFFVEWERSNLEAT